MDLVRRSRGMFIIDFGVVALEADAAGYEAPFELLRRTVKEQRAGNKRATTSPAWKSRSLPEWKTI
jgi:hypothetical protein